MNLPLLPIAVALIAALVQGGGVSQPARAPIDVSTLGLQIGTRVADFALKDQDGKTWTLQSVMGPPIVNTRSASSFGSASERPAP